MIQMQTVLQCADNSGASALRCIKVLGGSKRKTAGIGSVIIVSVIAISAKKSSRLNKVKKGDVCRAIIVSVKKAKQRKDGNILTISRNAAVLVDKQNETMGTRIFGPVDRGLHAAKLTKILSLAPEVL